jgi:hypothetical protein
MLRTPLPPFFPLDQLDYDQLSQRLRFPSNQRVFRVVRGMTRLCAEGLICMAKLYITHTPHIPSHSYFIHTCLYPYSGKESARIRLFYWLDS